MKIYRFLVSVMVAAAGLCAADVGRGRELYVQGKYDDAVTELRQAVQQNGEDAAAQRALGMVLLDQDKLSEAEKPIRRAEELNPGPETNLALARLAVAQKNYDKAQELLANASGDDLPYVRGLLRFQKQQYQEAADDLESYLEKYPGHPYAHYYAGLAYNNLRKPDKMLTHFERFLQIKPDAPEARKVRAVLKTGR
jgi:tetratricopeptide (TPR) repeat protein